MINKLKGFWVDQKDTIKNTIILVAVPLAIVTLKNINRINKIAEENNVSGLFYEED